jgi:hypothetical protein
VPSFLIETYTPDADTGKRAAWELRVAAAELAREGTPVRYVRTTFLPGDETAFHVFEAPERETVVELGRRVGLAGERVVAALEER